MKKVFISYATEDQAAAVRMRNDLNNRGIGTWLDVDNLLPGQNWRVEIVSAIRDARAVVALLSSISVSKQGFFQKEVREAIRVREEFPGDPPFLILARLDDCHPRHHQLLDTHWVDLFVDWDIAGETIAAAINAIAQQMGAVSEDGAESPVLRGIFILRFLAGGIQEKIDRLREIKGVSLSFVVGGIHDYLVMAGGKAQ